MGAVRWMVMMLTLSVRHRHSGCRAVDREAYKAQEEALKHFDNSFPAQGTDPAGADGEEVDEYFELYDSYDEATYGGGDARVLQQQEGGSVKEEGVSREERQPSQVP